MLKYILDLGKQVFWFLSFLWTKSFSLLCILGVYIHSFCVSLIIIIIIISYRSLNMVVGANGTGKSSILNAICLGLGGDQNLLGRADDARDYIQHGKDHAVIEIHVAPKKKKNSFGDPENQDENNQNAADYNADTTTHVFRREIASNKGSAKGRGRGASTFYINDEKVTVDKVREMASRHYNISIDNLCTFLPQDKVGSFSGFNAQQLLIETEKTLSSCQHYYHTHMELIEAELKKQYDRLKADHDRMHVEKERMEEREEAVNLAHLLNKKRLWMQVEYLIEGAKELKSQKSAMKQKIRDAKAAIGPLEQEHQAVMAQLKECNARHDNYQKKIEKCLAEKDKQDVKFERHDTEIENVMTDLQELDSKRHALEKRRDEARNKLAEYEAGLAELPSLEEITQSYNAAYKDYQDGKKNQKQAANEERRYHDQLQELSDTAKQVQDKLARMMNEGAQRKARIFRQNPQLAKIHEWIEANRSQFRRSVWGPIACEISPQSEEAATFIEQHVPNTFLKAFVVESKEDEDKLYDAVRNRLKLPINIIVSENGRLDPCKRPYSDQKMAVLRSEHDVSWLDDLFEAPDAVMQALRNLASVHKVLVGGKRASENIEHGKGGLLEFLSEPEPSQGQSGPQSCKFFSNCFAGNYLCEFTGGTLTRLFLKRRRYFYHGKQGPHEIQWKQVTIFGQSESSSG
jgi:structural maintenance of chromosomes protein 5